MYYLGLLIHILSSNMIK